MTLQEKTKITNDLIDKYHITNDGRFKNEAWDIIEEDVRKIVNTKFSNFKQFSEDIYQDISLIVNNLMEKNSSFDTSKGRYILCYMTDLNVRIHGKLFEYSSTVKFHNKDRASLSKYINEQKAITPEIREDEIIASYVKNRYPNLDETKYKQKLAYFNELYFSSTSTASIDDPIDENGTTRGDLIADSKDPFEKIEIRDEKDDFFRTLKEMKDVKELTPLEYDCVYYFCKARLIDPDVSKAKVAKFMGKSRQNFVRALTSGIEKVSSYMQKRKKQEDV